MAIRIRETGELLCAALHPALPGDVYLDDGVHYRLSVELGVIVTEPEPRHSTHGVWWWRDAVPADVEIER